jgi:hypothetical protein
MNNVHTLPDPANEPRALARPLQVATSRFVTIELAAALTGFTPAAIRSKIFKGEWLENRQFVKRDGRVLIDLKGYEAWAESGRA